MIAAGILWFATTCFLKAYANSFASLASLYSTRCTYFVILQTITYIALKIAWVRGSLDLGNLTMKSIVITFHSLSSTSVGLISLYGLCVVSLVLLQVLYSPTTFSTIFLNLGT